MRNRAILMLGLAVVFAIAAAFIAQSWLRSQVREVTPQQVIVQEAPKPPETTIVVASRPLFYGNELTRQNVREISWLADDLPPGAFKSIDDLFAEGQQRIVLRTIEENEAILDSKISGDDRAATLSAVLEDNMRAVTLRVNDVLGVAGFVIPGDRVDMLLTREAENKRPETSILLQNVKVLGIDQQASEDQDGPKVVKAVTVEVTPVQALKTVLGTRVGTISLALRNRGDADATRATKVTLADLGIGEAFQPTGSAPRPAPSRRGANIQVTRGLKVYKYRVNRETFEPLSPSQLTPPEAEPQADNEQAENDVPDSGAPGATPQTSDASAEETPALLLPPDRVNF